jgi:hypothetical protein
MILTLIALQAAACVPAPAPGHAGAHQLPWSVKSEVITVGKKKYTKYGLPRVLGANEVELLAPYKGGFVYTEAGQPQGEVVYVLHRFEGCEFQPYQIVE